MVRVSVTVRPRATREVEGVALGEEEGVAPGAERVVEGVGELVEEGRLVPLVEG